MAKTKTAPETAPWCNDCEQLTNLVRVYECNTCGGEDEERRCDQCNRFKSRREDDGCENCYTDNVELVEVVTDHDGQTIRVSDYDPEGESYSVRHAVETEARNEARKAAQEAERLKEYAGATLTPWSAVKPGDVVLREGIGGGIDTLQGGEVLTVSVAGENAQAPVVPGTIFATIEHYSTGTEAYGPDDEVWVKNDVKCKPCGPSAERYFNTDEKAEDVFGSSIKRLRIRHGLTYSHRGQQLAIPVASLMGSSSIHSNMWHGMGTFCNPEDARTFAAQLRVAAERLRNSGAEPGELQELKLGKEEFQESTPDLGVKLSLTRKFTSKDDEVPAIEGKLMNGSRLYNTWNVEDPAVLESMAGGYDKVAEFLARMLGE